MLSVLNIIFPVILAVAAVSDVRSFTIPNTAILILLVSWPVAVLGAGVPLQLAGLALLLGVSLLAVGLMMYAKGILGAGDVKLLSVSVLWIGAGSLLSFLFYTALAGAAFALALVAFRRVPIPGGLAGQAWLTGLHSRRDAMPYGVAIAIGGILIWAQGATLLSH